jgi:glycosyltransferase involved in cell wall biosynthesis
LPAPKISIIIPTFNRVALLKDAIDSALAQKDYCGYEVIVGDNSGTATEYTEVNKLIDSYNDEKLFYYKHEKNLRPLGNWNRLVELARGEYVTMLHDDDWIDDTFLAYAAPKLKGDKLVAFKLRVADRRQGRKASGAKAIFKKLAALIRRRKITLKAKNLIFHIPVSNLSALYKRDKMIELGGYCEGHGLNADNMALVKYIFAYGGDGYAKKFYNYRLAQNDTLTAAARFPEHGYMYREALIEQLVKDKSKDKLRRRSKYSYDIERTEIKKKFGIACDDILKGSSHRDSKLYGIELFTERIRQLFRECGF